MKKKILIAFVAMLSLVLMPMGVKAASYKDYFTLNKYISGELGYILRIKNTYLMSLSANPDATIIESSNVHAKFEVVLDDGTKQLVKALYSEARVTENGEVVTYLDCNMADDIPANFSSISRVIFEIQDGEYEAEVSVDVSKLEPNSGVIENADEIVTEKLVGTGTTPEEPAKVEDKVVEVTKDNNTVSKDVLNEIKANGNKVTYESKKDDKVSYAWIFDGSKMTTNDLDVNLELVVNAEDKVGISKLIPKTQEKPIVLDFKHSGVLPEGTRVKVNVADTYKDGDKVTLYYYNETTKKLEEKVTNIEVKDGFVEFSLEHCSIYTLARVNTAPNNAYTASMNVYLYIGISIISLIGIGVLIKTGKKKIA